MGWLLALIVLILAGLAFPAALAVIAVFWFSCVTLGFWIAKEFPK